ncbi:PqiC family protein [Propionivibrio sp.]|uniref:PqiC family protein n=1 Tax=Propionivibrio sp. TaxID=2212460 RepID=UPI003BF00133
MIRGSLALIACVALVAGCGSTPKERFYVLGTADTGKAPVATASYSVVVGPISVPETVDRPQFVLRTGSNQVMVSELNRWAEPLKKAIPRVIAAHLALQLGTYQVYTYPQTISPDPDFRVLVDVQRFELAPGQQEVILEALWSIQRGAKGDLKPGHSLIRETSTSGDYGALVSAQERALTQMSQAIAESVRTMDPAH